MKTQQVSTTQMLSQEDIESASDVPGGMQMADYDLTERIGAGGYGEVWKAIGPGGLPKAVKVLYGERTGRHAEAELKALERMRDLRHPFLLSIERIEVADSRLVVVTELADGNLAEKFDEHRANGAPGIPRDELLGYLKDAADALDFMAEQHGLQHLDIKPDNLLLQGNHAKVGDFGLAKDLNTTNVSIINGFTPMFAAPELFEGRPGRASDQYSLAIVYQLMLTGVAPFNGRTAAQLTAQHLRSQPDLTSLQPIDRPVIARALSKNMNARFENCRQFVDELARRKHSRAARPAAPSANQPAVLHRTALVDTQGTEDLPVPEAKTSTPVRCMPVSTAGAAIRPAVIVGVGGLAGEVLLHAKHQVADRSDHSLAAVLQIDTDRAALSQIRSAGERVGLTNDETLAIPLRSANDYRSARNMDLSWMSRRWLFNIPRSGQVDGIRPLGRLALCDHQDQVRQQLERVLKMAQDAPSQNNANDRGVDVYVLASTAGGTGSGAVADVGMMVREVARLAGIDGIEIHGVLLHGTGATRNVIDVQDANTVCTLKELRHLLTPGLGTPRGFSTGSADAEVPPFDHSYVVHLGNGLNSAAFARSAADVAGFLAKAVTTDAGLDLRAWRAEAEDGPQSNTQLRLLGIGVQDASSLNTASQESGRLSALLLREWCGAATPAVSGAARSLPAELTDTQTLLAELNLTDDKLPQHVMTLLRGSVGRDIESCAESVFRRIEATQPITTISRQQALDTLSAELSRDAGPDEPSLLGIVSGVRNTLSTSTNSCHASLDAHFSQLLDSPHRLKGTFAAIEFATEMLRRTAEGCGNLLAEIETALTGLVRQPGADSGFQATNDASAEDAARAFCRQYCVLLAYQTIYQCFINHVDSVSRKVHDWGTKVERLKADLQTAATELSGGNPTTDSVPGPVIDAFDRHLRKSASTLLGSLASAEGRDETAVQQMRAAATQFLLDASNAHSSGTATTEDSGGFPENAWPKFRGVGGRRRVLAVMPAGMNEGDWKTKLTKAFGECVVTRKAAVDSLAVICEIEGVPIESVLTSLTHNNPHVEDVAGRIHTRTDVDW